MNSTTRSLLFWMALVVALGLIWNLSSQFRAGDTLVSFSEFIRWVDTGQVDRVELTGNEIIGRSSSGEEFRTYAPPQYEGLANQLLERDVVVEAREAAASPWTTLFYSWAPLLLIVGFWVFFMRQMQSGGNKALSFGKSRAKLSSSAEKKVTFKDVAGVDEPKEELQEIIEFLKEPQKFQKLGGRIPKGVLLMGRLEPARHCWQGPSLVRRVFRSFRSVDQTLWKCSSGSAHPGFGTYSSRARKMLRALFLSTRSTRWVDTGAPAWGAVTMNVSRL